MYILRDRTKFNSDVDLILQMSFEIETNSSKNAAFPGFIKYLCCLDEVWDTKGTPTHAAIHMACLYCRGLAENGDAARRAEAQALWQRISEAIPLQVSRGQMPPDRGAHYSQQLEGCAERLA